MRELNPLLHSQLRLGVMSILMNVEEADFVYLREICRKEDTNNSPDNRKRAQCLCRIC